MSPELTGAIIGLAGALVGVLATMMVGVLSPRWQASFRVREKIADKQIAAYEAVLGLVRDLRESTLPDGMNDLSKRVPCVLENSKVWEDWRMRSAAVVGTHYHWLDANLRDELQHLQNYLLSVTEIVRFDGPAGRPSAEASIVRDDFIEIAAQLERLAVTFLKRRAHKFVLGVPPKNERVTESSNLAWLKRTRLFKHRSDEIGRGKGGTVL